MIVRVYGHYGATTGYGIACQHLCMSLIAAGCTVEIRPLMPFDKVVVDHTLPLAKCIRRDWELKPADAIIVHTLPMDCAKVLEHAGEIGAGMPLVAYTTWEAATPVPDAMRAALSPFGAVWLPSTVTAKAFSSGASSGVRSRVVPHAFDVATLAERRAERDIEMDAFRFYYVGAWSARKNPEGLIRAYVRAFSKTDRVSLSLRCVGASREEFVAAWHRTGVLPGDSPPIHFANMPLPDAAITEFHRVHDCYVTATRGEAWNLPAFEAVLAQRHVISCAGLGSDDFLFRMGGERNLTSASEVVSTLAPAGVDVTVEKQGDGALSLKLKGAQGLSCRDLWVEPDLHDLSESMRIAYAMKIRYLTINYDLAERFSYESVGRRARTLLESM